MVYLFSMVFNASQSPDEVRTKQKDLSILLSVMLCIQVVWALVLIPHIIFSKSAIVSGNLPFLTLLVTAILAEVVAMAFFVVRYVFHSPITDMAEILRELIKHDAEKNQTKNNK